MNRLKEVALFLAIAVPAGVVGLIITPSGRTGTSRVPYDVGGLLGYCVFLLLRATCGGRGATTKRSAIRTKLTGGDAGRTRCAARPDLTARASERLIVVTRRRHDDAEHRSEGGSRFQEGRTAPEPAPADPLRVRRSVRA